MYDIESFISRRYVEYKYYGNPPTDISICCPFCESRGSGDDHKFHLQIHLNPDKQVAHCFRCGYSASWIQFVMDAAGLTYLQALSELYVTPRVRTDMQNYIKGKMLERVSFSTISKEYNLPKDFRLLSANNKSQLDKMARAYILQRGFKSDIWKRHNLGVSDDLGFRLIIPIEQGYWQGRALFKWVEPKYINPKEPARDILFNVQALQLYDEVVICEGFFSAIAVGENAIALIGKEPTEEKIRRILKSDVQGFIIAMEARAFGTMQRLADALLRNGRQVTIWNYETGDPADTEKHDTVDYNLKAKLSMLLKY